MLQDWSAFVIHISIVIVHNLIVVSLNFRVYIDWIESGEDYKWKGFLLCTILLFTNIVNSIITHLFFKHAAITAMRVRTATTAAVYRKVIYDKMF